MERTIDDLPMVKASALAASGAVRLDEKTAILRFTDDGVEYVVGVAFHCFKNGGWWARLLCPGCGRRAQKLRLLDGKPVCGFCVRASGLIYRSQATRTEKRHLITAPVLIARLNGAQARVNRPGRKVERRAAVELKLRQSLLVPRRFGIAEFEKTLKKLRKP
jgi:hypothetical protein